MGLHGAAWGRSLQRQQGYRLHIRRLRICGLYFPFSHSLLASSSRFPSLFQNDATTTCSTCVSSTVLPASPFCVPLSSLPLPIPIPLPFVRPWAAGIYTEAIDEGCLSGMPQLQYFSMHEVQPIFSYHGACSTMVHMDTHLQSPRTTSHKQHAGVP